MKLSKPIKNITYLKNSTYDLSWTSLQKEITEGAIIEFDNKDRKPLVEKGVKKGKKTAQTVHLKLR